MSEEKDKGGRPPMPDRLKKGKMVGARFTPHTVAQLRAYAEEGESLTAALERLACETLDAMAPAGARYFTVNEARLARFPGDTDGLDGVCVMRAIPAEDGMGFFVVEFQREKGEAWKRLSGEWRPAQLPVHEDESSCEVKKPEVFV